MQDDNACGWLICTSRRHCERSIVQNFTFPSLPPETTTSRVACTACTPVLRADHGRVRAGKARAQHRLNLPSAVEQRLARLERLRAPKHQVLHPARHDVVLIRRPRDGDDLLRAAFRRRQHLPGLPAVNHERVMRIRADGANQRPVARKRAAHDRFLQKALQHRERLPRVFRRPHDELRVPTDLARGVDVPVRVTR
eukprot:31316-Pelagococcus_subviridis.AAC.19